MKNILIVLGFAAAFIGGFFISQKYNFRIEEKQMEKKAEITATIAPTAGVLVGGDIDENGCKPSAGYTWCEAKNKCIREWEEKCEEENNEQNLKNAILAKHGWNENEVDITISKNDGTFARGGIKEKAAVSGGMFLAKETDGEWVIVFEGNGAPDCALLKTTHAFPPEFLTGICD